MHGQQNIKILAVSSCRLDYRINLGHSSAYRAQARRNCGGKESRLSDKIMLRTSRCFGVLSWSGAGKWPVLRQCFIICGARIRESSTFHFSWFLALHSNLQSLVYERAQMLHHCSSRTFLPSYCENSVQQTVIHCYGENT